MGFKGNLIYPFFWYFTKSPVEGAQTTLHCSVVDHEKLFGGAYYSDCTPKELKPMAQDKEEDKRLWDESVRMLSDKGYSI